MTLRLLAISPLLVACLASAQSTVSSRIGSLLDDLDKVKPVGAVALSPDGHTVAMVLGGVLTIEALGAAPDTMQPVSVCPHDSSADLNALSWSPDGNHLAVLAGCAGEAGVYLIDDAGRDPHKARRLAELHGYAQSLAYAPDGRHLALLYVEGATRHSGALAAMKPPSGVIGVEGLEIQRVATLDTTTGKVEQVTPPKLHVYEFDWSPDSAKLAYIAAPAPGENNWWVARLYSQSVTGGQPQQLLDPVTVEGPLHGLQIAVPRWSPDGARIAFIGGLMSDQGATGGDFYLLPAAGGVPVNFTADATTTMQWFTWTPDQHILATLIDAGSTRIEDFSTPFILEEHMGSAHRSFHVFTGKTLATLPHGVADGRLEGSFSLSKDAKTAAWAASSFTTAPEVYAGPLSQPLPAITHLNTDRKPSWGKSESVEWTNDGFHVQGWLLYPAHYDPAKKYPLIVMVHGGPSSAVVPRWPGANFGAAPFSAMDYFVLEPNPRGSFGQGEAFTQANRKDFGYGDLRDILAGVDVLEKKLPIDNARLGLTGWSYGGFMTMFDITQTHRFRAAVAGAGIANWQSYYGENSIDQWMLPFFGASVYDDPAVYAKSSAITFIKQVKTPTLIVVGDRDGECPAPQSFEFWHALKAEGVDTQLVVYPNEGHGFVDPAHRRDVVVRAINWFDTHMQ